MPVRWIRLIAGLAVLEVLCLALGALVSLLGNGLLASANGTAAIATLAVLVAAFAVLLAAIGPQDHWTTNPYW